MNNTGTGSCKKKVDLFEDTFGTFLDKRTGQFIPVRRFTWRNQHSVEVQVISYGATVTSIKLPDKNGIVEDIVMGFDTMEGYLNPLNPYFGATVGRVANRIGGGKFKIDGHPYQISLNKETFTLHGGYIGFDKVVWEHTIEGTAVIMSYVSNDGDEGFPGSLLTNIRFELTNDNEFKIEMSAYTTKPTIVNLTNHSYFNLGGHNKGAAETYKHTIQINGNKITDVDNDSIPTGELLPVRGSIFDLETPRVLGDVINKVSGGGYDQNFCVNTGVQSGLVFVARACHVPSSRSLEVYSNQPGVQFYTANFLPTASKTDEKLIGKNNSPYYRHGSFCFETQNYPDAVNHENFPNEVLRPGKTYTQITHWIFSTVNQDTC